MIHVVPAVTDCSGVCDFDDIIGSRMMEEDDTNEKKSNVKDIFVGTVAFVVAVAATVVVLVVGISLPYYCDDVMLPS